MNQNINPKSLKGKQVFNRALELMNKLTPINESIVNYSLEFVKRAPNNLTYTIIRENHKYFIKTTDKKEFRLSELDYIGGLKNKMSESYPSYEEALKHLNMKFQQINEIYGIKGGLNLFEMDEVDIMDEYEMDEQEEEGGNKEKKYKLKVPSDDTSSDEMLPTPEMGGEESPEMGGEMETPSIEDVPSSEEGSEESPEMGGEEGDEFSPEMGAEEDEEDFDIDIDEDEDPKKYIQKLTGRLGQKLRELSEVDPKLEKYVINSIISALHIDKMDKKDRIDIMKKFKKKRGMESVMSESYDMDEYYGMRSIDGPHNYEKLLQNSNEGKQKPIKFKKYELGLDKDENWAALGRMAGSAAASYIGSKLAGNDESMDPVGHEDSDVNNDGKTDKQDKYLLNRRKKIANALARIKSRKSDERFGAYDDIKFKRSGGNLEEIDIEDLYDFGGEEPEIMEPEIDTEIEKGTPIAPPKPKFPNPYNPPIPDEYTQPKARMGGGEPDVMDPDTDIDTDTEIEIPGAPPVPKIPNPFNPPIPDEYTQPKARR